MFILKKLIEDHFQHLNSQFNVEQFQDLPRLVQPRSLHIKSELFGEHLTTEMLTM